jgi:RHS repeat-associated protein
VAIFVILLLVSSSFSQGRDPSRGFQFANSYASGGLDSVNVNNGNLIINVPVASLPKGRGTSPGFTVTLQYNSKIWDSKQTNYHNYLQQGSGDPNNTEGYYFYTKNNLQLSDRGGWKMLSSYNLKAINRLNLEAPDPCLLGDPIEKVSATWKMEMEFPDGSVKQFIPVYHSNKTLDGYYNVDYNGIQYAVSKQISPANSLCYLAYNSQLMTTGGMHYVSTDGSRLRLYVPYQPNLGLWDRNWKIYSPDGTTIENQPPDDSTVGQRVTDRNGGFINIKGGLIVDQMGRSIEIDSNGVTVKGVNGESLTTQIIGSSKWVYRKYLAISDAGTNVPTGTDFYDEVGSDFWAVQQIILPTQSGGQTYNFEYNADATNPAGTNYTDGWGELKSVTFPTGAKATYTYSVADGEEQTAAEILDHQAVKKELAYTEIYDGNPTPRTETTYYDSSPYGGSVTNPDGSGSGENVYHDQYLSAWNNGLAYRSGVPGITTERVWKKNLPFYSGNPYPYAFEQHRVPNANAYVKTEFSTIYNAASQPSLTAIKDFNYDKNGNVTKITEYDWISYNSVERQNAMPTGVIPSNAQKKRITVNEYYNQTPDADSTASSPYTFENPSSPKLKNVIKSTEVQDANGTPVSRSEFYYDNPNTTGNLTETRTWDSTKQPNLQAASNGYKLTNNNFVSSKMTYDQYGNPLTVTDAKGVISTFTYDAVNGFEGLYPTKTETASNYSSLKRTATATYDFYTGLAMSATDVDNNLTSATEYDALGRPKIIKAAVGTANEIWTQYFYDDVLRRTIVKSDLETVGDGKKVGIQHYDQLGRVYLSRALENSATEDATNIDQGIKVQTRYLTGNPYSYQLSSNPYRAATSTAAVNEPSMGWTRSKLENTGKHSEAETFSGAALPAPWGSNGSSTGIVQTDTDAERTLVTDQVGKQRMSKTNALGQLTDVWEIKTAEAGQTEAITFGALSLNGYKTSYQYDTLNNLTKVIQGTQPNRNFTYSSLSRLLSASNPESGMIGYVYDDGGNLTNKTDARGVQTTYGYDALNRVISRSYNDNLTPTVAYTYDNLPNAKGKLTKVSSSVSTTEYTAFDIVGRVKNHRQTTDGQIYDTGYTYNLSGALIEETYPSGRVVKNTLDADGMLQQVQSKKANDTFRNYANSFNYTAAGAVSSVRLGNGKWENTAFNSRLQPTQIGLGNSATDRSLLKLDFTYNTAGQNDNNGNVLSQTITVGAAGSTPGFTAVQTYTYDALNRIYDAKENIDGNPTANWKQTFDYDRYGNRRFNELNTTTITKNCTSGSNAVVCAADVAAVNPTINQTNNRLDGYTFDTAGNTKIDALGRSFIYDAENKQTEVRDSQNNPIGKYYYDGDGKRVKKEAGNETTIFIYDAAGKLVAEYSNQTSANPQISYLTTDHLGSPRINTDASGQVTARHDYLPFGEEINRASYGNDDVRNRFTSYERDNETNLDFAQARMLGNSLGRFTSPDPAMLSMNGNNPQSFNRYIYVMNNPLLYTDPLGLWAVRFDPVYKQKDGKATKEVDYYIAVAVQTKGDKDTPAELARQLGLKGKEADKFVKNFGEKLGDGKITADNVQLSKLGGDVGRVFGIVQDLYSDQKKFEAKNGVNKDGPSDSTYNDCSATCANLNSRSVGANSSNWNVFTMDDYIKNNLTSIAAGELRIGDVVRYGLDETNSKGEITKRNAPKHFTTFLFTSDGGDPMVFSRSGVNGRFQPGRASDFEGGNYGTIRGVGKDATGYYGRK